MLESEAIRQYTSLPGFDVKSNARNRTAQETTEFELSFLLVRIVSEMSRNPTEMFHILWKKIFRLDMWCKKTNQQPLRVRPGFNDNIDVITKQ